MLSWCEFVSLGEIDADTVSGCLFDLQLEDDLANSTYNHYRDALSCFCNWLVRGKRLSGNPIEFVERLSAEADIRHRRRALTSKEFADLINAAMNSKKKIQTYTGVERARIYITAYYTGLRRRELGHLKKTNFKLDASPPTLTVRANISKHRKEDVIPINDDLVAMIKEWTIGFDDEQLLFPKLDKRKTWLMVKKDLEAAGIPYKNSEGIADFHAAGRHTYITELLRNGVTLAETMKLARHSDVRMTMRYAHIGIDDQAKAVQNLPRQDTGRKRANSTGQDESSTDNGKHEKKSQNPDECEGSGSKSHGSSIVVKDGQKRRTRGSNPQPLRAIDFESTC